MESYPYINIIEADNGLFQVFYYLDELSSVLLKSYFKKENALEYISTVDVDQLLKDREEYFQLIESDEEEQARLNPTNQVAESHDVDCFDYHEFIQISNEFNHSDVDELVNKSKEDTDTQKILKDLSALEDGRLKDYFGEPSLEPVEFPEWGEALVGPTEEDYRVKYYPMTDIEILRVEKAVDLKYKWQVTYKGDPFEWFDTEEDAMQYMEDAYFFVTQGYLDGVVMAVSNLDEAEEFLALNDILVDYDEYGRANLYYGQSDNQLELELE